jgi:hypothetical protein
MIKVEIPQDLQNEGNNFHRKNLKLRKSRSGKVHVVAQAVFTGALEQDGEMGAFRLARSAADQNDQARLFLCLPREIQEVVTVAAYEDQPLRTSIAKNLFIGCGNRQYVW